MLARRARAGRAQSSLLDGARQKSLFGSCLRGIGNDGTVRVWSAAGGEPLVLREHEGSVFSVAFALDGRLASSGSDGTVRVVWIGQSAEELIAEAQRRLPRELTLAEERRFYGSPALCVHVLGWPESSSAMSALDS